MSDADPRRARGILFWSAGALLLLVPLAVAWWAWSWRPAQAAHGAFVPVRGGDGGGLPRATPAEEHFDKRALEAAESFAATMQAHAFLVMRHDHLVVERYGRGVDRDTVADAGGFATVLVLLAAGIAQWDGQVSLQEIGRGDLPHLVRVIESASGQAYAEYLSAKIWSRLNAAPAWIALARQGASPPVDCCLHARSSDWLRVAGLLLDDGSFEGERVVPAGWIGHMRAPRSASGDAGLGLWLAPAAHGAEGFAADDVFFLRGPGHWRLWLMPTLGLAVLLAADAPPSAPAWDETRLPNLVIRAITDQVARRHDESGLSRLVPGH